MQALALTTALLAASSAFADPTPPTGFAPLFNGKDLTGWHGMPHHDPYELDKLSPDGTDALRSRNGPRTPASTGP